MKKSKPGVDVISFSNITTPHWTLLFCVFGLALVAFWQAWLPFFAERHYRDGYNFDVSKRYKFAIEEYQIAVDLAPWETQYQMELAKVYASAAEDEKNIPQKIEYLKKALEISERMVVLDDRNPWYKNRLATVYLQMAEAMPEKGVYYTDLAQKSTLDAALDDKQNPLFQLNIAYFLHRKGDLDESMVYYNKVIQMDPRIVEARYNMADIYRRRGNMDEVLNQYLLAVKNAPDFVNLHLAIASTYIQRHDLAKAVPYLENAIRLAPTNFEALKNLAAIYMDLKQWHEAARVYGLMMANFPDQVDLHPFYIQALVNDAQEDQAIYSLTLFLQRHPDNGNAKHQLQLLQAYQKRK